MLSQPTPVDEGPMGPPDPAVILSPAVPAVILLPVGSVGPVGPDGMLSPSDSKSAILVDPGGCCPCSVSADPVLPTRMVMVGIGAGLTTNDATLDCGRVRGMG